MKIFKKPSGNPLAEARRLRAAYFKALAAAGAQAVELRSPVLLNEFADEIGALRAGLARVSADMEAQHHGGTAHASH